MSTWPTLLALNICLFTTALASAQPTTPHPNIVLIYTDDVGYGDVGCYGATGVETSNIDRLSTEGLRFRDAHCAAATCTPSRYSLLTGSYAFRNRRARILPGNANLIIAPGTETLASALQRAGYATGVVGKWHLGLGEGDVDWNSEVKPGPREIGFDYHFLIPATGDRVPCVYLEQGRVVNLDPSDPIQVSYDQPVGDEPTGKQHPELLKQQLTQGHDKTIINGISRIGYMTGGQSAWWIDEDMADVITQKAVEFVERRRGGPFFLYFSTHDIHVPRVPHQRFVSASNMGPRGDALAQMDWCVGQLLAALDRLQLSENTLVIFSSDNGPVLDDGYRDEANEKLGDHRPAVEFRGGKYSKFEGGTRVPLLVRWPGRVEPGSVSDALVGQVDFARSLCDLVAAEVPENAFPDSQGQIQTLLGRDETGRDHLLHESWGFALRQGHWKYIAPGRTRDRLGPWRNVTVEEPGLLFDLSVDARERKDVSSAHPDRLDAMKALLESIQSGAS